MKRPRPRPLEKSVLRAAVELLRYYGCDVHRRNIISLAETHRGRKRFARSETVGASDLWGILPAPRRGTHFELEIKRPGERPRLDQVEWLMRMNEVGAVAFWVDDVGLLDRILGRIILGFNIVYREDRRKYTIRHKVGGRILTSKVWGPSGDYDLRRGGLAC